MLEQVFTKDEIQWTLGSLKAMARETLSNKEEILLTPVCPTLTTREIQSWREEIQWVPETPEAPNFRNFSVVIVYIKKSASWVKVDKTP